MKTRRLMIAAIPIATPILAGYSPRLRVGELRTEPQSVEVGEAEAVTVEIQFGAGNQRINSVREDRE